MESDREDGLSSSRHAAVKRRGTFHAVGAVGLVTLLAIACSSDPRSGTSDGVVAGMGAASGSSSGASGTPGSGGSTGARAGTGGSAGEGFGGIPDGAGGDQGGEAGLGNAGERRR